MDEISIGFDPAFIDIIVKLLDEQGKLLEKLPLPGHHHRMTRIDTLAGGNGVNIASMLVQLGYNVNLVVPVDEEFIKLLQKRKISKITPITGDVNHTVAITWKEGEIQLNEIKGELGREQWTRKIDDLWKNSPVKLFINWGLNKKSLEWVSMQLLSLANVPLEKLTSDNIHDEIFKIESLNSHILLEPGSLHSHPDKNDLMKVIQYIMSLPNEKLTVLLANEEEGREYSKIDQGIKIIHTKSEVRIHQGKNRTFVKVPALKCQPDTYLGSGDAFLSGIIDSILLGNTESLPLVRRGISNAQKYLCESKYI